MAASHSHGAAGRVVLAAAAHPDDIEFMMAGTLLQLKAAGAECHMWNLLNGYGGSAVHAREAAIRLRWEEAQASARLAGARLFPPIADDIALVYDAASVAKVTAVIREVRPALLLVPSPQDYMEDHQNTCRLLVSGAFVRGVKNFVSDPPRPAWNGTTVVYHALPYGLRDGMRKLIRPGQYVEIGAVLSSKREMLARHVTQKEWLDASQGLDSYLDEMESMSRHVGRMSGRFEYAEGWRRHSHLGFAPPGSDPLSEWLPESCWTDPEYEKALEL